MSSRIVLATCAVLVCGCVDRQQSPKLASTDASGSTAKVQHATSPDPAALLGFPWLVAGRHGAEVMTLAGTPEMEAIATRLKESFRMHQAWFEQYTAQYDGQTLPWHANMGVSPEDYQAFVQSGGNLAMHKQIDTTLIIEEAGPEIALSTGGKWKFFDGLKARISKDGSQGNTTLGPLSRKVDVVASEAQSVTGPWGGSCWRASALTGLCLGKTNSGRGILVFEARSEDDTRPQANTDFVVLFDLASLP